MILLYILTSANIGFSMLVLIVLLGPIADVLTQIYNALSLTKQKRKKK